MRDHCRALESQLAAYRVASVTGRQVGDVKGQESVLAATRDARQLKEENEALRGALENMRDSRERALPGEDALVEAKVMRAKLDVLERDDTERVKLAAEVVKLTEELQRVSASGGTNGGDGGGADGGVGASYSSLRKQMKEFVLNTQAELEREKAALQARCLSAEGQLEELNAYLKKSTISYQQEIMRLRTAITKVDPAFK